jgi:hypothetical protein
MKRYLLFFGDRYPPDGGIHDLIGDFDAPQEVYEALMKEYAEYNKDSYGGEANFYNFHWFHVYDCSRKAIVCSSDYSQMSEILNLPMSEQIENYDPHEVSKVQCDLCSHQWIAVRPEGLKRLECPNCGNLVTFENVEAP